MNDSPIPTFAELEADPEIAPLLNFTPVVRKVRRPDGWTEELQRELIARLAATGTIQSAVAQMGKHATGAEALYKTPSADSFRKSWDAAIIIGRRRNGLDSKPPFAGQVPGISRRGKAALLASAGPLPGQVMNERGEWEDEDSVRNRNEEAKDSVATKLLRIRRLFLSEIAKCPGKRAAFEILTQLPIDWDKAKRGEPQDDEPYRSSSQHKPDMVLMAESGWSFGSIGYGPDKMAELYAEVDRIRRKKGLPAISWETRSAERSDADGETKSTEGQPDAGAA